MKDFLIEHIRQAGAIAREYFVRGVTHTTKSNPVDFLTEADLAVSSFLVDAINKHFPTHHIKSEELSEDINVGAEYEWIIDPIDGTKNFAKKIPFWGVIIAVLHHGEPVYGAVYFPVSDQLILAEKGKGTTLNGNAVSVSTTEVLTYARGNMFRSVHRTGPYGDYFERYRVAQARVIMETDTSILNFGSATAISFVATGSLDFAIGNAGLDWDCIAPIFIAREAGAIVTDSDGNTWTRGRQDYVVANPVLHPQLISFFKPTSNMTV